MIFTWELLKTSHLRSLSKIDFKFSSEIIKKDLVGEIIFQTNEKLRHTIRNSKTFDTLPFHVRPYDICSLTNDQIITVNAPDVFGVGDKSITLFDENFTEIRKTH